MYTYCWLSVEKHEMYLFLEYLGEKKKHHTNPNIPLPTSGIPPNCLFNPLAKDRKRNLKWKKNKYMKECENVNKNISSSL